MFEFLLIPGIGPKTAFKLCQELKIKKRETALKELKKAVKSGKLKNIAGFGEQSAQKILKALSEYGRTEKRLLLPVAFSRAEAILNYLKLQPLVIKAETLGSLRRHCATVGDIDIAVASKDKKAVIDWFIRYPKWLKIIEAGENKARALLSGNIQVDLMVERPAAFGSLLQHFTGSKQHNIALREIALKKGLSLSEHGIKKKQSHQRQSYETEEGFYQALGMVWIPPELRENYGEIELAQKNQLPKLVELKEIKGDLHLHSDFNIETSHDIGTSSLAEIYQKGEKLGYEYLALSEHNPSLNFHSNSEIIDLIKRKKEYIDQFLYSKEKERKNRVKKIFIFNSLEIDIRPDGKRAISDEALDLLDFAIVSVHSSFRLNRQKMTQRVLRALDHPKVKILGHPTGRKLLKREGYELDWEKIFEFCLKNHKYLEINAWPDRLDLPDFLIREAVKVGVKLVVTTDSHSVEDMELIRYGVWTARRGWATKADILNTLSYNELSLKIKT